MVEITGFDPRLAKDTSHVTGNGSEQRISFADYLRILQGRRGLSQRGLAALARIDHSTISRLRSGDRNPGLATFAAVAESLSLSDQAVYVIVLGSLPEREISSEGRIVYKETAPVLSGNFGEQLAGYREQRGLSQRGLTIKAMGVNPNATIDHTTISRLETEDRKPMLSTFAIVVYTLGLNSAQVRGLVRAAGKPTPK